MTKQTWQTAGDDETDVGQSHVDIVALDPSADVAKQVQQLVSANQVTGSHMYVLRTSATLNPDRFAAATAELASLASQADIEHAIAALTPRVAVPRPAVLEQARRNVILREELLAEFGGLAARDVADLAGSNAVNRAQYAHALRSAGKLFSVVHRRQQIYPAFQFATDGEPLPVVADVLAELRGWLQSDWERALWFTTENTWLDNARPVDLLVDKPAEVVDAAEKGANRSGF